MINKSIFVFWLLLTIGCAPAFDDSLDENTEPDTSIKSDRYYLAFSLKEAERLCDSTDGLTNQAFYLAGMTRLAGLVYDSHSDDLILVGQHVEHDRPIPLEHFVVALRSVIDLREYPLVSLDKSDSTASNGRLAVRFQGGVENTSFGQEMLEADIFLKRLGLGLLSTESAGFRTYISLSIAKWLETLSASGLNPPALADINTMYHYGLSNDQLEHILANSSGGGTVSDTDSSVNLSDYSRIGSRFWLYPGHPSLQIRDDVCAITNNDIICLTEMLYAVIDGVVQENLSNIRDENGEVFSLSVMDEMYRLCVRFPELRRVKTLIDLVALAKAVDLMEKSSIVTYWLKEFSVNPVQTPDYYDRISSISYLPGISDRMHFLEISGGLEIDPFILRLEAGDVTALRKATLTSRPDGNHILAWRIPIDDWQIPDANEYYDDDARDQVGPQHNGVTLNVRLISVNSPKSNTEAMIAGTVFSPSIPMPAIRRGGVNINPRPTVKDSTFHSIWNSIIESRTSDTSLYWDVDVELNDGE